ncbi:ECF transporter S component [Vagococcus entomophilus]|uniref:ECF transporter S component n=1 Tax=Vagococcus entomophilus TaxID=1160095 RepID=A0A430AER6_9ENTE|nr:ECF transporter S component [Vagococcus entomophilus]RSU05949.1 hypothetical protein CBF30_11605 [Vagococcus entomophilus]
MKQQTTTKDLVFVALFAALTVIGTSIRIPMPAAIGNPFVHLGNSVLLLAVLLIGYKKGALAGGLGFAIFDILNGFALEAPYFLLEAFVVGGVASLVLHRITSQKTTSTQILIVALFASLAKLIMTFLKGIVMVMLTGVSLYPALLASSSSLFATVINCLTTIIVVTIAYRPLKKIMERFTLQKSL